MQNKIESLGVEIFKEMKGEKPNVFNGYYWHNKLMDWVMKDPKFKTGLFRFVDAFPQLGTSKQIIEHLRQCIFDDMGSENKNVQRIYNLIDTTLIKISDSVLSNIFASIIRKNIRNMATRFIVGNNAENALKKLHILHRNQIGFTVDLLGEYTLSEFDAEQYRLRYMDLIENLAKKTLEWEFGKNIDITPRVNVSIKISALESQLKSTDLKGSVNRAYEKILPLFLSAKKNKVFLNCDLEQWEMHNITYDLFESIVMHPELRDYPYFGIVCQSYLRNSNLDLERLLALVQKRGTPICVRLVKGAYWDFEVINAKQKGFTCPVFTNKYESDLNYECLSRFLLDNFESLNPAFGSHNLRSICHAITYAEQNKISVDKYEIQMLYGMAEPERRVLSSRGHRIRVYAPIGELFSGMAYLVRRLLENTSNSGFLKLTHKDNVDPMTLLAKPNYTHSISQEKIENFENCQFLDFTEIDNCEKFQQSIESWINKFPIRVPVIISGEKQSGQSIFKRFNPNNTNILLAEVELASISQAETAVRKAFFAFENWQSIKLSERTSMLLRLGDLLKINRIKLAALLCHEIAKPWAEADAEVGEAVDFCNYYAQQAFNEIGQKKQGNLWGEDNILTYEGRGPTLIISPWNFPLAILCGMTVAALVSGNPVIIKPAENSSLIANIFFELILEAGFPVEVCQFLPGQGSLVGAYLVEHPLIAQIAFTGSKEVGLSIIEKASRVVPGQLQIKRVICEMGGKNAIIIDESADIDEAVSGVIQSSFSFSGQKCSACSRLLVHDTVYDLFIKRLIEACRSLIIAPATDPACSLPPVIDSLARERLLSEITHAKDEFNILFEGSVRNEGNFVPPTLIEVDEFNGHLMNTELFGPIVTVLRVKSFENAINIANSTEFALTGAVYSRSPLNLEKARKTFKVGNLYLNRGSTGAMVHRQPFGGFRMSGFGIKAGGPGYLLHFVNIKCVTENTMRRGFVADLA